MGLHPRHPLIPLLVGALLVSCIGAGMFAVWAVYDIIPSTVGNSFVAAQCVVFSSRITSYESCPCADDGFTCSDVYPCIEIMVNLTTEDSASTKTLLLYKDMRGQVFNAKCSYYPLGRACVGNSTLTKRLTLLFLKLKGRLGTNYTCYTDNIANPTIVVSQRNTQDIANLAVFIISVILFFLPTLALNIFFLYKWQFLTYLGSTLARHHRVSVVPPPIELDPVERRLSNNYMKTLHFDVESSAPKYQDNESTLIREKIESE